MIVIKVGAVGTSQKRASNNIQSNVSHFILLMRRESRVSATIIARLSGTGRARRQKSHWGHPVFFSAYLRFPQLTRTQSYDSRLRHRSRLIGLRSRLIPRAPSTLIAHVARSLAYITEKKFARCSFLLNNCRSVARGSQLRKCYLRMRSGVNLRK